jgi:hypothetical protein
MQFDLALFVILNSLQDPLVLRARRAGSRATAPFFRRIGRLRLTRNGC